MVVTINILHFVLNKQVEAIIRCADLDDGLVHRLADIYRGCDRLLQARPGRAPYVRL
jgi:hypothetical protein